MIPIQIHVLSIFYKKFQYLMYWIYRRKHTSLFAFQWFSNIPRRWNITSCWSTEDKSRQYHGCWWLGDVKVQDISSHASDQVIPDYSGLAYRQTSNISHTLVGNKIAHHSDVVGASPVGPAPTKSSFSTQYLASMDYAKTTARRDDKHLNFGIWHILEVWW